ncbi:MAG: 2-hydroxyacyl-CoA dehydratase family protein [Vulcanimicrobiota bacterium]
MEKIGITTTIPVEVIYASQNVAVDLNNIFITAGEPGKMVREAELAGLPRNLCSWVKGIYSAILQNPDIKTVVAVTEGDCSNTLAMLNLLKNQGIKIINFSYPYQRNPVELNHSIEQLESIFGVKRRETEEWRVKLDRIRKKALEIDRLSWEENRITGMENHLALISCSDFEQDPDKYGEKLDQLLEEARKREPFSQKTRLGFCGVPPIFSDFYSTLEKLDTRIVFNEMQRQFAMPGKSENVVEQYLSYTYPYSYEMRIKDINQQIKKRRIEGMIHYIQSFCHHQIYDNSLKQAVSTPVLTLEGDKPEELRERTRIRLESFLEMLKL